LKIFAISALAMALATPAFAGSTIAVPVSGLDLAKSADAATVARRLDRAAADVCGAAAGSVRMVQVAVRRSDCYREAMSAALASLNAPAVNAALKDRVFTPAD